MKTRKIILGISLMVLPLIIVNFFINSLKVFDSSQLKMTQTTGIEKITWGDLIESALVKSHPKDTIIIGKSENITFFSRSKHKVITEPGVQIFDTPDGLTIIYSEGVNGRIYIPLGSGILAGVEFAVVILCFIFGLRMILPRMKKETVKRAKSYV